MSVHTQSDADRSAPRLVHPGPVAPDRVIAVPAVLTPREWRLPAGLHLLEALEELLIRTGSRSAVGELVGGELAAFFYYIPDVGRPGGPVANFSAAREGQTPAAFIRGGLTLGRRDGSVFAHSHALFRGADGQERAGHLVPESVVLGEGVVARVWTAADVEIEVQADQETGMSLFVPREAGDTGAGEVRALMCRVRPNVDLVRVIESLVTDQGWAGARVRGQIGSLVGGRLRQPDGSVVEVDGPATEVIALDGSVRRVEDHTVAQLRATMVDRHAAVHHGELVPGQNPVAMTFELVLTEEVA